VFTLKDEAFQAKQAVQEIGHHDPLKCWDTFPQKLSAIFQKTRIVSSTSVSQNTFFLKIHQCFTDPLFWLKALCVKDNTVL
jgi:hypothetical protein